jgi:ATP-binding cassette, subfamily B, bacterial PglK
LLIFLGLGLFLVDPIIALATILLFVSVGFFLFKLLQVRAQETGRQINKITVNGNNKLLEVLNSFRENAVRNRLGYYSYEFGKIRSAYGTLIANQDFQPFISKYVIESVTVFGALMLGGYEFSTHTAVHAVSILSVFLTASSRIAPGALRIQQNIIMMKNSSGSAETTLTLIKKLDHKPHNSGNARLEYFKYEDFQGVVHVEELTFSYPNNKNFLIDNVNLDLNRGSSLALVGASGSGKTTFADLIAGIRTAQSGIISISGVSPSEAIEKWPGAISYVPQNINIFEGTVRENVGQGYPRELQTDSRIWTALKIAQLDDVIEKFENGLDEFLGEGGAKLSGGERQRIGIARALFSTPKLLILDEATSALDGETEFKFSQAISKLAGSVTLIIIAHRLSTVQQVQQVAYFEHGKLVAIGSFQDVRSKVKHFDHQANLMGL